MNSPAEVAKNYIAIGKGKATNGFWKLLVLGMLAGAFIAFGAEASSVAAHNIGNVGLQRLVTGVVFPVGLIMIGEALAWDTDPDEMRGKPFYRVMGFVVDQADRHRGVGGDMLEGAIEQVYNEFGKRSLALGVHRDNLRAGAFYERHGFRRTGVFEGSDEYYLRIID